jgi:type IV pilus assembly protein PilV
MESAPNLCRYPRPPRRRPARRGAQRGVALMEVLVSILIFAFGLIGLLGLEATAINFSVDSEDRSRAALLASEIASTMWANNSVNVPAATLATWNTNIANPTTATGLPGGVLSISPHVGTTNYADITITWVPKTDNANANLGTTRTLKTRVILP